MDDKRLAIITGFVLIAVLGLGFFYPRSPPPGTVPESPNDSYNETPAAEMERTVQGANRTNVSSPQKKFVKLPFAVKSSDKYSERVEFGKKLPECPAVNVVKSKLTLTEDVGGEDDFARDELHINPEDRFSGPKNRSINGTQVSYRELINTSLHYITFRPERYFLNMSVFEPDKNNITHVKSYLKIRYRDNAESSRENPKAIRWENTPVNGCDWTYSDFNPVCSPEGKADGLWKEISCELTGVVKIWSNACNRTGNWASFLLANMEGDGIDYAELSFEGFDDKYFLPDRESSDYFFPEYKEVTHRSDYIYETVNGAKYCVGADVEIKPDITRNISDFQERERGDVIFAGKSDYDMGGGYIEKEFYDGVRYIEGQTARECNNVLCPFWIKINDMAPYVINITLSTQPDEHNKIKKSYELLYYDNNRRASFPSRTLGIRKVGAHNASLISLAWLADEDVFKNLKPTEINNGRVRFFLKQNGKVLISRIEANKFYYTDYETEITPLYNYQNATYYFEWFE